MPPKKVLIVGAGASGMSCAHHMSTHPNLFAPTVLESTKQVGGQAFSIPLPPDLGASWLNQGVQGGSNAFRHTLSLMSTLKHPATPVRLQVSFGKHATFWTNMFKTQLVARHAREIGRFVRALSWLGWAEPLVALVPAWALMRLLGFSTDFVELLVLPSVALFLGTGNETPSVPAIAMRRLYTSPNFGMWNPPHEERLAANMPPMVVFPELSLFYGHWAKVLEERGVAIRLETTLLKVHERGPAGVVVTIRGPGGNVTTERYDELVLCVLADTALVLLGDQATWVERAVLGGAKWSDDITVTHTDAEYMRRHYTTEFDAAQAVEGETVQGTDGFCPMYYVRPSPVAHEKIELSFDCTHYQPQFAAPGLPPARHVPPEKHVFQSIFLNKDRDSALWTKDEIRRDKVIREDWWHQLCHSWTHYVRVVPWVWALNWRGLGGDGGTRTTYAGSWTVVNAHEVAILSGLSAAWRLGASYPEELRGDKVAWNSFWMYTLLCHGKWAEGGPWIRGGV